MALAEQVRRVVGQAAVSPDIPPVVEKRVRRGREWMRRDAAKRRLCVRFERGDQYWYLTDKGYLNFQASGLTPGGTVKPNHRIRNTYNIIRPIVQGKVSKATQRVPSYQILPSTTDPEDVAAARLGEKVALYGYDKWRLRRAFVKAAQLAIGGGGSAFVFPYFDPNVGPYTPVPNPETGQEELVGQGEVKVLVLSGNEVFWEPGVEFYESRWWVVERARPIDDVQELPGFFGKRLEPDATTGDSPVEPHVNSDQLVLVTEYYERPCPAYPEGRRIVMANGRVVTPPEQYPLRGRDGKVIDEPILHRLQWNPDCTDGSDLGLTWQLIDPQRTINDCWNKLLEWKNRCLNPRMSAPRGSNLKPRTDEPGAIDYYDPVMGGTLKPEWEQVPTGFAGPLFDMMTKMQEFAREIGYDSDISADSNVAARTVNAVIEQDQAKWQSFMGEIADCHARVMRHCLQLVQVHYSEPRKLAIRGRFGPESIADFDGAQLLGQLDVRVLPSSLDYMTREQMTQRVMAYADRQWITPQQALLAIQNGTDDQLIQGVELDLARVDRIIQKIRDGSVMDMPPRDEMDPLTGQVQQVPSWMPQDQVDDLGVWRARVGDWMKTQDYEQLPAPQQEVAKLIMAGIEDLERRAQQRQLEQQNAQAESLGLQNAAKPQQVKSLPNQPSGSGDTPPQQ